MNCSGMKHLLMLGIALLAGTSVAAQSDEGPPYHIFSIYFGGGSWYIDEEQSVELFEWLDSIEGLENHEISIHGHTDDIGSIEYNRLLAHHRCESAFGKLLEKGIPGEVISVTEFGEESPVFDNSTWSGKLKNRRVDIIIRPLVL